MSIDRAATLLQSSDLVDNRNGATLVINAAATSANVPEILNNRIIELLLPKMNSNNTDLVMKCCWAINNLSVHENGRNAAYKAGCLKYFPQVLSSTDGEVIKKACWALTNLARNAQAQKDIVRGEILKKLIRILSHGSDDDEKGYALQPLCNLVFDAEHQLSFQREGGIPATVRLLSSSNEKTKELAVTLVSFVTTNHDSIREELVDSGVLPPLCALIKGQGNVKMQEHAINSLVNLSLAEKAERAILVQNAVEPIVGLLSSDVDKLQQQAAMLLSNLLTNSDIREAIRYFAWVDPIIHLVTTGDVNTLHQVLRVIINVAFDAHCRYMLQRKNAKNAVDSASKRVNDVTVKNLAGTAVKNLAVPVASDVQSEVDNAVQSNRIKQVSAPRANKSVSAGNEFEDLDEVLGNITGTKPSSTSKAPSHTAHKSYQSHSSGADDLDSLLDDFKSPSSSSSHKPHQPTSYGKHSADKELDDLFDQVTPQKPQHQHQHQHHQQHSHHSPASKPAHSSKPAAKSDLDDIDDLLADINSGSGHKASVSSHKAPSKPAPAPAPEDDIDDLLSNFQTHQPTKSSYSSKQSSKASDLDDIDSLLADIDSSPKKTSTSSYKSPSNDDIDDLLLDIDKSSSSKKPAGYHATAHASASYTGDDIDDLLGEISRGGGGGGSSKKSKHSSDGLEAIDDLLADLTG